MSKVKIEKALKVKGITAVNIEYERGCPVPESKANGWLLEFSDDTEDDIWEANNDAQFYTSMEFDTLFEVMNWIAGLPNLKAI
ncbi:MAG: hypothetical protein JKY62_16970 [Desulfocapsa sp.]|nr:hypothetical protein [Desulfocapsa sp.]